MYTYMHTYIYIHMCTLTHLSEVLKLPPHKTKHHSQMCHVSMPIDDDSEDDDDYDD
jgi:hypothetical protein